MGSCGSRAQLSGAEVMAKMQAEMFEHRVRSHRLEMQFRKDAWGDSISAGWERERFKSEKRERNLESYHVFAYLNQAIPDPYVLTAEISIEADQVRGTITNLAGSIVEERLFHNDAYIHELDSLMKKLKPEWVVRHFLSDAGDEVSKTEKMKAHGRLTVKGNVIPPTQEAENARRTLIKGMTGLRMTRLREFKMTEIVNKAVQFENLEDAERLRTYQAEYWKFCKFCKEVEAAGETMEEDLQKVLEGRTDVTDPVDGELMFLKELIEGFQGQVGHKISVAGREGTLTWDGRPKHQHVKVKWDDDKWGEVVVSDVIWREPFLDEPFLEGGRWYHDSRWS